MNKIIKSLFVIIIITFLFISTIISALAYDIDSIEDSYTLSPGDSTIGSFIVSNYSSGISANSDFEWISFNKNSKDSKINNIIGRSITENVVSIPYYIDIPKDADIGIYRTVIEFSQGNTIKYLNIKISVQKKPIAVIFKWLNTKIGVNVTYTFIISILFIILIYLFIKRK